MSRLRAARRSLADAQGGVLVFVAVCLPIIIGVGGLAVDVGNWFVHKRHLQVQADAGLLAAAAQFRTACTTSGGSSVFAGEVAKYGSVGTSTAVPGGYNPQVGATPAARMHSLINSKTFYNQAQADDTDVGDPCLTRHKMIDVKLTETDLPWFLKAASIDAINAQARAEIREKTIASGTLPIAVPETGPKRAWALFVDEATGHEIARQRVTRTGTSGGLSIFDNADSPVTVPTTVKDIGVRIMLSGSTSNNPQCGDQLVLCYGAGTNAATVAGSPGLVHVRGWSDTPAGGATSANPPQVRGAELYGATCEDPYFTMLAATYPCTVNVGADVDFGTSDLSKMRVAVKKTGAADSTAVDLTAPGAGGGMWTGGPFTVAAASNDTSFDLLWKTGCPTNRNATCANPTATGTVSKVQRVFSGSDAANGTVRMVKLSEGNTLAANSFRRCPTCAHSLVVTLGLSAALRNDGPSSPAVSLKLASGGQSGSLDCDPALDYRGEFATGCAPKYKVNDGSAPCPGSGTLFSSPQPWQCAAILPGARTGQVSQGLDERVLGSTPGCPASARNKWPTVTPGDKRIVTVMVTSFGAFSNNSGTVPVTGFATFYMSGWTKGACQSFGDDPADAGEVVGHFISFVDTIDDGTAGTDPCDLDSLGSCTVVLTR